MYNDGVGDYDSIILEKLKGLERKLELSFRGMTDDKKLASVSKDLSQVRSDILRLKHGELSWENLKVYNIFKNQMEKVSASRIQQEAEIKTKLSDFNALADVPIKEYSAFVAPSINELFSMVEYISSNYMALFTQKVLLFSSRSGGVRESIYRHYQELVRLFNHYFDFSSSSAARNGNRMYQDDLLHKEYVAIFKKYHAFINSLRQCIDSIQKDEIFTPEDFSQTITGVDAGSRIAGLTFRVALEECKNFANEVEEYMTFVNRDFFDAIDIDNKTK